MNETVISETARVTFEQSLEYAVLAGFLAWAIHVFIFAKCVRTIKRNGDKGARGWLLLVVPLFLLSTMNILSHHKFNQLAWVTYRDYPGGPLAFFAEQQSIWTNLIASASAILALSGTNIFMVYRHHLQMKQRFNTALLCFLVALTISVSIFRLVQLGRSSSKLNGYMPTFDVPCGPLVDFAVWYGPIWASSYAVMRKKMSEDSPLKGCSPHTGTLPIRFEIPVLLVLLSFVNAELGFLWNAGANTLLVVPFYIQVACIYVEISITRNLLRAVPAEITLPSTMTDVSHLGDIESQ